MSHPDQLYRILEQLVEVPAGTIQGNETLADFQGWDSLAVVGFIAAVDKHYQRAVPVQPLIEARTVGDLAALLDRPAAI
ncbi:MAG: acyl carrier protein [Chthoniobacter sp.]